MDVLYFGTVTGGEFAFEVQIGRQLNDMFREKCADRHSTIAPDSHFLQPVGGADEGAKAVI
jgi:hypothetical protein